MFHTQRIFLLLTLRVDLNRLIVVAGHQKVNAEDLGYPYMEVYRSEDKSLPNRATKVDGVNSPTISWSEYAQFFYAFPLPETVRTFGFIHYRSMLDLRQENSHMSSLPYSQRKEFAQKQLDSINHYNDRVVIGMPLTFPCSSWQQFVDCHPKCEPALKDACKFFDSMFSEFNINSENILKSNNFLYSRNMFISPVWFANKWSKIALDIVKYLDDKKPEGADDRWGGFILERLFSVYVHINMHSNPNLVVQKPIVFFEER